MEEIKFLEINIDFPNFDRLNITEPPHIFRDEIKPKTKSPIYSPDFSGFIKFEQTSIGTMVVQSGNNLSSDILSFY